MFKILLLVIVQVLFCQNISGSPIVVYNAPFAYESYGYSPAALAASNGGGLIVTSASPIEPYGVSLVSENIIEGVLDAYGVVPFLGTIGVDGVLPTIGAGVVSYGCGDGGVAMVAEDYAGVLDGYALPYGYYGLGYNNYGYNGYRIMF